MKKKDRNVNKKTYEESKVRDLVVDVEKFLYYEEVILGKR